MRYNVAQLLKEPIGSLRSYQLDEKIAGPLRHAELVSGPVNMLRVHHGILVSATVDVRSNLICSRCLREYPSASQIIVEEEFFPTVDPRLGRKIARPEHAEEAALIDSNHVLDLTGTINECVITNLPMKPLCQLECKGLCQSCGANQNLGSCQCADRTLDPRWQALAGWAQEE